jgi:hypothetical protein
MISAYSENAASETKLCCVLSTSQTVNLHLLNHVEIRTQTLFSVTLQIKVCLLFSLLHFHFFRLKG